VHPAPDELVVDDRGGVADDHRCQVHAALVEDDAVCGAGNCWDRPRR
jgi:hypothetical protein